MMRINLVFNKKIIGFALIGFFLFYNMVWQPWLKTLADLRGAILAHSHLLIKLRQIDQQLTLFKAKMPEKI